MKKITVFVFTIIFLTLIIYLNFLQPKELVDNDPYTEAPLDNKIVFENVTLDLGLENQIITFGELIALTGKTIYQWDLSVQESDPWYENYIESAITKNIVTDERRSFESSLSFGEAIDFFVRVLEINGETKYPIQYDFYENEVARSIDKSNIYYRSVVKALSHGIITSDISSIKLSSDLTKGQAHSFITAIVNKKARYFPFIVLDEFKDSISIRNHSYPVGIFLSEDNLIFNTELKNTSNNSISFWYGLSLQDPTGQWYDLPAKKFVLSASNSTDIDFEWEIPEKIVSGNYHIVCSIWDSPPQENNSKRIAHMEAAKILSIYNFQDNFSSFDTSIWKTSTFTLGRTDFLPENVSIENSKLIINMPAKTFKSGEIQSPDFKSYGSYEIRMKLPDAKGSITGFFMYKAPDYYHEIDIEIYNDKSKEYFLTTYADGKIQNEFLGELPFDVTSSYNNYRFDYYPDRLDYYINDIFIVSFKSGYSHDAMHLILNCWYPNWLEDGPANEDISLLVEWIRY